MQNIQTKYRMCLGLSHYWPVSWKPPIDMLCVAMY